MKALLVVVVVIAVVLIYAATRPDELHIERSIVIRGVSPERIVATIADLHSWQQWSPWIKMDPAAEVTYSGAPQGVGAIYEWQSKKIGQGRMEITEVTPDTRVLLDLTFIKPMAAHNHVAFVLAQQTDGVQLTWRMTGSNSYLAKLISVFVNMDKMVGKDFERGLADLKAILEK